MIRQFLVASLLVALTASDQQLQPVSQTPTSDTRANRDR